MIREQEEKKMVKQIRKANRKREPFPNFCENNFDKVVRVYKKDGPFVDWTVRHEWKLYKNMEYFRGESAHDRGWVKDEIRDLIKDEIRDSELEPEEWDRSFKINKKLNRTCRNVAKEEDITWFWDEDGYDDGGYDRDGYNEDGYDEDGYDPDGYDWMGYNEWGMMRRRQETTRVTAVATQVIKIVF